MKNRKLWRALVAALLCAALLCPTFALAEEEGLLIDDTPDDILDLDLDAAFDGALPDLPDLDLVSDLAVNDVLIAAEDGPIELGGETLANETGDETGDSQETPAPENVVTLEASYTGATLTKVYDCTKYGAAKKTTGEIVYYIEALKTIKSQFELTPAEGQSLVEGHEDVNFKVSLSKQFDSADVGKYKFEFTLTLTGDDAAWYTLKNPVVKVNAVITPRPVTVTPRENLSKVYGAKDPVYAYGTSFTLKYTDGTVAVQQDVGGVPTYGVPTFTSDQATAVKYLIAEAKLKNRDFFPGFLDRKAGEKPGRYRITRGALDFGSNFKMTLAKGYFTITPIDISGTDVTVSAIGDRTYTGKAIKPTPVVKYNGKKLKLGTDYKLKYANNKTLGSATIAIIGRGNYTGTRKVTFRIVLKPTTISKLTPGKGQITVAWKKGSLNAGYQIGYSTDPDFISAQTMTVKGIDTTKATLKNLQSKTTYYVRVRTYKTVSGSAYYSAWSKAKSVKTK